MRKQRVTLLAMMLATAVVQAQTAAPAKTEAELRAEAAKADAFLDRQNSVAALPLYEDLHAQQPGNLRYEERLAMSLLGSATQQSPQQAAATRERARKLLLDAQGSGDNSNMVTVLLEKTGKATAPEPPRQPGQDLVDAGEKAFTRGDLDGALENYRKALEMNPRLYGAALFAGDVEFKRKHPAEAGEWFAKAIAIDQNTETAHRYWGDTLEAAGNHQHAEQEFIAAIVAQPYGRAPRVGLQQWAMKNHAQIAPPPITLPAEAKVETAGTGGMNVTLPAGEADEKNPDAALEIAYTMMTVVWHGNQFHQEFPTETTYRHSLPEIAAAVRAMLTAAAKTSISDEKLNTSVKLLRELDSKGLLESWILLDHADQGIAQDYPTYREGHRALLATYIAAYDVHPI